MANTLPAFLEQFAKDSFHCGYQVDFGVSALEPTGSYQLTLMVNHTHELTDHTGEISVKTMLSILLNGKKASITELLKTLSDDKEPLPDGFGDRVHAYLVEHPGASPYDIAIALGEVRGGLICDLLESDIRFVRDGDAGWSVRVNRDCKYIIIVDGSIKHQSDDYQELSDWVEAKNIPTECIYASKTEWF